MPQSRRAATVGTFDGVHRGHIAVIEKLKAVGAQARMTPTVITFDRHPLSVVAPEHAPRRLMMPDKEAERLRSMGVEVEIVPFTPELMRLTAAQWMQRMKSEMNVDALVVGYDNTFGCDGVDMSVADYIRLGQNEGIVVSEAPVISGSSSSAIRRALTAGDVEKAGEMLGYRYTLEGNVVHGRQLGRTIGFPTANLAPDAFMLVPANGVYAADAGVPDGRRFRAVVNIGNRPTVGNGLGRTIEAHIIGYSGDLYGQPLRLEFLRRLRNERQFASLDALRGQITADVEAALRDIS